MKNYFNLIKKTNLVFNNYLKKKFIYLCIIFFFSSFIETLSVFSILPFITMVEDLNRVSNFYLFELFQLSKLKLSNIELLLFITISFISIISFSGYLKIIALKKVFEFSALTEVYIRNKLFNKILHMDTEKFNDLNLSKVVSGFSQKIIFISMIVNSFLIILSSFILIIFLSIFFLTIKFTYTLLIFLFLPFLIFFISRKYKKKLLIKSKEINFDQNKIVYDFQNLFGLRTEIILKNLYDKVFNQFKFNSNRLSKNFSDTQIISNTPRIYFEVLIIIVFLIFISILKIYSLVSLNNSSIDYSLIFLFGFGAMKVLPLLGKIYSSLSTINSFEKSYLEILGLIYKDNNVRNFNKSLKEINFKKNIKFENICYKYPLAKKNIFLNFNASIKKGLITGITGNSGSGKSTLIKILAQMLTPQKGRIYVDGVELNKDYKNNWQSKIYVIPQKIYLINGSLRDNLIFGLNKKFVNKRKIYSILSQVELTDFLKSLKKGIDTNIGEDGSLISGGEKQRIVLGRALLNDSQVIILDESTNALDLSSEHKIIKILKKIKINKTIIIISHSRRTLRHCDKIININNAT